MKIGILAYHAACNFGAFLQLLSTVEYVKKRGDEPFVINWVPRDFRKDYEKRSSKEVRDTYASYQRAYYPLTNLCETAKEVAQEIERIGIEAVIIGSDAVCQHHPFRERFHFPTRRIFYLAHPTSDRMYPNCFWGTFNDYLKKPVPIAVISASSQDSKFYLIKGKTKAKMKQSILNYKYISVRDDWSQKMISYLTDGEVMPEVTPDPVFAFNHNASDVIPSKNYILKRFNIPNEYILVSFKNQKSVSQDWITEFEQMAEKNGLACVKLPYADAQAFGNMKYDVGNNISPLEWYALIKYAKGYVGNNMHPIVTSLSNGIPFFSFDNYGIAVQDGKPTNGESSKIYHILKTAELLQYRIFTHCRGYSAPSVQLVYDALKTFDVEKEQMFAKSYYIKYVCMMDSVYKNINKVR